MLSPPRNGVPTEEEKKGFVDCQRLAQSAVREIASLLQQGWSERQAADQIEIYLRDHGVKAFFHKPYAWFGERSRFDGISRYADYMPTDRILRPGEPYILDVAPILHGYVADIGYSDCLGANVAFEEAITFLKQLRREIPSFFSEQLSGGAVCQRIETEMVKAGYDLQHRCYPFSVIGHRVYITPGGFDWSILHFGWQSFWSLLSRGLVGQLLNENHEGDLLGFWAIEPHLGTQLFGAKFEEILVVEANTAYWLEEKPCFCQSPS